MSGVASSLLRSCGSLLAASKHCICHAPSELDEAEVLLLLWHMQGFWRQVIHMMWPGVTGVGAALTAAGGARPLKLSALEEAWNRTVDRKAIAAFGESVGVNAAVARAGNKVCGPLLPPLMADLSAAVRKRSKSGPGETVPVDLLVALTGTQLSEWQHRYFNTFVQEHVLAKEREERVGIITNLTRMLYTEWAAHAQTAHSSAPAAPARTHQLQAEIAEFRQLFSVSGPLWHALWDALHPSLKQGQSRRGGAHTIATSQEQGAKHKMALAKVEVAIVAAHEQAGGGVGGHTHGTGSKARSCKYASCAQRLIGDTHKFASLRCTAGCVLSMHHHCYLAYASEHEEVEAKEPEAPAHESYVPCPARECEGELHRVLLRQQGKTLAMLLEPPVTEEDESKQPPSSSDARNSTSTPLPASSASVASTSGNIGDDDDDEDDDDDDAAECDDDASASSALSLLDPSLREKPTRRQKKQMRAWNIAKDNDRRHVQERFTLNDAGQMVFSSIQIRKERAQAKHEKKERDEARAAEAKKRREEEAAKREKERAETQSTSSSSAASSAPSSPAKPFTIEVVFPLQPKSRTTPPLKPASQPPTGTAASFTMGSVSKSSTPPIGKHSRFSSLQMDDPESDSSSSSSSRSRPGSVRSAWNEGRPVTRTSPAFAVKESRRHIDPEAYDYSQPAQIPITVKVVKNNRGRGVSAGLGRDDSSEDEQVRAAMAASMTESKKSASPPGKAAVVAAPPKAMPMMRARSSVAQPVAMLNSAASQSSGSLVAGVPATASNDPSPVLMPSPAPGGPSILSNSQKQTRREGEPSSGDSEDEGEAPASSRSSSESDIASASNSPVIGGAPQAVTMARPVAVRMAQSAAPLFKPVTSMPQPLPPVASSTPAHPSQGLQHQSSAAALAAIFAPIAAGSSTTSSQAQIAESSRPLLTQFPLVQPSISSLAMPRTAPLVAASQLPPQPLFPPPRMLPVPSVTTGAVSAAAPVPAGSLQLVDHIVEADEAAEAQGGCVLLLYQVPLSLPLSALGGELCVFGRLTIKLVLTMTHGCTAVLQYASPTSAAAAVQAMRGRTYMVDSAGREPQAWTIGPRSIVYAKTPLQVIPPPQVTLRISAQQGQARF